jgi:hypothetical protein
MEELHKLLDMEESLSRDFSGHFLRSLREGFQAQAREMSLRMDQGLSEAEFSKHAELRNAVQLADSLVEKVWRFMHNRAF